MKSIGIVSETYLLRLDPESGPGVGPGSATGGASRHTAREVMSQSVYTH